MDNALIDDRRIHVDFSQSVAKLWFQYKGKGRIGGGNLSGPFYFSCVQQNALVKSLYQCFYSLKLLFSHVC